MTPELIGWVVIAALGGGGIGMTIGVLLQARREEKRRREDQILARRYGDAKPG